MKKKWLLLTLVVCSCTLFFVSGCSKEREKPKPSLSKKEKRIQSFKTNNVNFKRVIGWLSNSTVLIQTSEKNTTKLYTYQLYTGKQEQIYQTKNLVADVKISPDKSALLIYDSANKETSTIRIIDIHSKKEMASKELKPTNNTFIWNAESPNKILLINYDQNWGFKAFLWDYNSNLTKHIYAGSPFLTWYTDNLVLYNSKKQQEDEGDLYLQDIRDTSIKNLIAENVLEFASNKSSLVTISNFSDDKRLLYDFKNIGFETLSEYKPPRTYDEAGSFVPYFDINFTSDLFLTFTPYESGKMKNGLEEYQLVQVDPKTGKHRKLLDLMDNAPLLSNEDKHLVLYGYDYGKVIDLKTNKVYQILEKDSDKF